MDTIEFDIARLMTYHPLPALLIMINGSTGLRLNPNQIRVNSIESLDGNLSKATVEYYKDDNPAVKQIYSGSGTVIYPRIDVGEFIGSQELSLRVPYPTTVLDVLSVMHEKTRIVFDLDDFEQNTIFGESVVLKSMSSSLRWVGETVIELEPDPDYKVDLSELIKTNILNGFYLGNLDTLNNVLSGFTAAEIDKLGNILPGFSLPGSQQP